MQKKKKKMEVGKSQVIYFIPISLRQKWTDITASEWLVQMLSNLNQAIYISINGLRIIKFKKIIKKKFLLFPL